MPAKEARTEIKKWMELICEVNREFDYKLTFISRSDSTLRSHFPLEVKVIEETIVEQLAIQPTAIFLIPAFIEGGRITQGDVHYMIESGNKVRIDRTEYSQDQYFGFSTSYLPGYIEEKANVPSDAVVSFSLEEVRNETDEHLLKKILSLTEKQYVVVNAESYHDLERIAFFIRNAEMKGRTFLFHTAASFVRSYVGQKEHSLLDGHINSQGITGIIFVGSFVRNTSRQLAVLLGEPETLPVELETHIIRNIVKNKDYSRPGIFDEAKKCAERIYEARSLKKTPVVFTPRSVIEGEKRSDSLRIGRAITQLMIKIARSIDPSDFGYIVAKGGITSHTILSEGFTCSSARVLGQILPGVPVVCLETSNTPYIIFPGNVGDEKSLLRVQQILSPNIS